MEPPGTPTHAIPSPARHGGCKNTQPPRRSPSPATKRARDLRSCLSYLSPANHSDSSGLSRSLALSFSRVAAARRIPVLPHVLQRNSGFLARARHARGNDRKIRPRGRAVSLSCAGLTRLLEPVELHCIPIKEFLALGFRHSAQPLIHELPRIRVCRHVMRKVGLPHYIVEAKFVPRFHSAILEPERYVDLPPKQVAGTSDYSLRPQMMPFPFMVTGFEYVVQPSDSGFRAYPMQTWVPVKNSGEDKIRQELAQYRKGRGRDSTSHLALVILFPHRHRQPETAVAMPMNRQLQILACGPQRLPIRIAKMLEPFQRGI